jgi:hypothetical protein
LPNYRYFGSYERIFPDKRDDEGKSLVATSGVIVEFDSAPSTAEWVETDEPVTWPAQAAPAPVPAPVTLEPVQEAPAPPPAPEPPAPAPEPQPAAPEPPAVIQEPAPQPVPEVPAPPAPQPAPAVPFVFPGLPQAPFTTHS